MAADRQHHRKGFHALLAAAVVLVAAAASASAWLEPTVLSESGSASGSELAEEVVRLRAHVAELKSQLLALSAPTVAADAGEAANPAARGNIAETSSEVVVDSSPYSRSSTSYEGKAGKENSTNSSNRWGQRTSHHGDYPYVVSVQSNHLPDHGHYCAGAIVTPWTIVTTASCCQQRSPSDYRVVAGEYELDQDDGTEQVARVASVITHPNFDPVTLSSDVCILTLELPLSFGTYVRDVPLARPYHLDVDQDGSAVFPKFTSSGFQFFHLHESIIFYPSILSDEACLSEFRPGEYSPHLMMCGPPAAGLWDRGMPLVCEGGYVCGLAVNIMYHTYTNWYNGDGFCEDYFGDYLPGAYTEIAAFREWIDAHTIY